MLGKRGEGWVAIQGLLLLAVFISPLLESYPLPIGLRVLGLLLGVIGGALALAAMLGLGASLTALPKPKAGGQLVTAGAYGLVRHPIYSGVILGSFGWSLLFSSPFGLVLSVVLLIFFDLKSRREERWLTEAYPAYPAYQRRVKKLVPWIY